MSFLVLRRFSPGTSDSVMVSVTTVVQRLAVVCGELVEIGTVLSVVPADRTT